MEGGLQLSKGVSEPAPNAAASRARVEGYDGRIAGAERELVDDNCELREMALRVIGRSECSGEREGRRQGPCDTFLA
jgi:hypothetical protein